MSFLKDQRDRNLARKNSRLWAAGAGGRTGLAAPIGSGIRQGGGGRPSSDGQNLVVAAPGDARGETVTVSLATIDIDPAGTVLEFDTIEVVPAQAGFNDLTVPAAALPFNVRCAYYDLHLRFGWDTYAGEATVTVNVDGEPVQEATGTFGGFASLVFPLGLVNCGTAPALAAEIVVTHPDVSDQTLSNLQATLQMVDRGVAPTPAAELPAPWAEYRSDDLTGYADGDPVTGIWIDRTGNGRDLTLDTGSGDTNPVYVASALGGFGGVTSPASGTPYSHWADYAEVNFAGLTVVTVLATVSGYSPLLRLGGVDFGAADYFQVVLLCADDYQEFAPNQSGAFAEVLVGAGPVICGGRYDADRSTVDRDGVAIGDFAGPFSGYPIDLAFTEARYGNDAVIVHHIIYDQFLSDSDLAAVAAALQVRYAL